MNVAEFTVFVVVVAAAGTARIIDVGLCGEKGYI